MAASLLSLPVWQVFSDSGVPLAGAKLYGYEAGTTTPKPFYTNSSGLYESNPVVFDSAGRADVWVGDGSYKLVLKDANDTTVWTVDNVSVNGSGGIVQGVDTMADLKELSTTGARTAVLLGYNSAGDGGGGVFYWDSTSTASDDGGVTIRPDSRPAQGRWKRVITSRVNARWFGATGDGTTNDAPAVIAARAYCDENKKTLHFDAGTYLLDSDPSLSSIPIALDDNVMLKWSGFAPDIQISSIDELSQHFDISSVSDVPTLSGVGAQAIRPEWFDSVTMAVQCATNSSVKTVALAEKTYFFTAPITLTSNVKIKGVGKNSILDTNDVEANGIVITQGAEGWEVCNLTINGSNSTSGGNGFTLGNGEKRGFIKNVWIDTFLYGVYASGDCNGTIMQDVVISHTYENMKNGILLDDASNLIVQNAEISNALTAVIANVGTSDCVLQGIFAHDNRTDGVETLFASGLELRGSRLHVVARCKGESDPMFASAADSFVVLFYDAGDTPVNNSQSSTVIINGTISA